VAGFLYFLPGALEQTPAQFVASRPVPFEGLRSLPECAVLEGPDGKAGLTLALPDGRSPKFVPNGQNWQQLPAGWWLGTWRDAPPTRDDLAKPRIRAGHPVTICDQPWTVPVARYWQTLDGAPVWSPATPQTYTLGKDGEIALVEAAEWRWFSDMAEKYWSGLAHGFQESDLSKLDIFRMAALALGVNYRVGTEELLVLKLLRDDVAIQILNAIVDWPGFTTILAELNAKKNASADASSPGNSGETASPQATDRPSPTSNSIAEATDE